MDEFICLSFDYVQDGNLCFLSSESAVTRPDMYGPHSNSDYYERVECAESPEPETPGGGGVNEGDKMAALEFASFEDIPVLPWASGIPIGEFIYLPQ